MRSFVPASLRFKIVLLTGLMTLLAASVLGAFTYRQILSTTVDTATEGLGWETSLIALKFRSSFSEIASDAIISSNTPPISGIFRSLPSGLDTEDNSNREQWVSRLESIFASIMQLRPHYTQMRFIGLADGGRELVRVDRNGGELLPTRGDDLQRKAGEDYFKRGAALEPGKVFVSEVTYNREFGVIAKGSVPTLRVVVPIARDGASAGMVVINVDYFALLDSVTRTVAPGKKLSIGNHDGDFYVYDPKTGEASYTFHQENDGLDPHFVSLAQQTETDRELFIDDDNISYFARVPTDDHNETSYLGVILTVPVEEFLAKARESTESTLYLITMLVAGCVGISVFASRRLTAPLINMTRQIQETPVGALPERLPIKHNDEIGDLARSFSDLAQRLISRESDARTVVDTVVDGIFCFDKDGQITEFNPACERMFGYTTHEILGQPVSSLFLDTDEDAVAGLARIMGPLASDQIASETVERTARRRDGSTFFSEVSSSRSANSGEFTFIAVLRDVTERKKLQILQDEFVSTVNHELRTPLTSIIGALGLLKALASAKLDDRGRRLLDLSYDNSKRLGTLVDDILDMEKIAAGKMSYNISTYEISELVSDIVNRHQSYADIYNVNFVIQRAAEPAYCNVDASRFNQALVNLLSNASKFSPPGSDVVFSIDLDMPSKIRVDVLDHGPGLPADFIPKVFEKFAQADSSSTRSKGGSGLGLSITKAIVMAFDGDISFETDVSKGTKFTIELPRQAAPAAQELTNDTCT